MRLMLVVCVIGVTLSTTAIASNPASPVRATMSTSSTTALVDTPWRYTIVVQDQSGRPLAAKVRLQILVGSLVVGCWKATAMVECSGARAGTWIAFNGKRSGVIRWPARSSGVKLTFQATVVAGATALKLRTPVTVRVP